MQPPPLPLKMIVSLPALHEEINAFELVQQRFLSGSDVMIDQNRFEFGQNARARLWFWTASKASSSFYWQHGIQKTMVSILRAMLSLSAKWAVFNQNAGAFLATFPGCSITRGVPSRGEMVSNLGGSWSRSGSHNGFSTIPQVELIPPSNRTVCVDDNVFTYMVFFWSWVAKFRSRRFANYAIMAVPILSEVAELRIKVRRLRQVGQGHVSAFVKIVALCHNLNHTL